MIFESEKQKAKVKKKIKSWKPKAKVLFISLFPFFSQLHFVDNSKISIRVL